MERPPAKLFDIVRKGIQLKIPIHFSLCSLRSGENFVLLRTCLSHTIT